MKKNMCVKYRNVDIDRVLSIPRYGSVWRNIYKAIFHFDQFDKGNVNSDILVLYSHIRSKRLDYFQIIENLTSILQNLSLTLVIAQPRISFIDKLKLVRHVFGSLSSLGKIEGSFAYKLSQVLLIARAKTTIDSTLFFLIRADFKVLVTFCDAHFSDNILVQCARYMGKKTVTLQHGQYHINDKDVPENMALMNLESDYLCAWGRATCDEFKKVKNTTTTVIPLGSLSSLSGVSREFSLNDFQKIESNKTICLMLNADNCYSSNIKMVKIVEEFCGSCDYSYCVRFHPKNIKSLYEDHFNVCYLGEWNEEMESHVGFSIIYTSGVMIDLLIRGEIFFLFHDESKSTPDLFQQDLITFENCQQLMDLKDRMFNGRHKNLIYMNSLRDYFVNTKNVDHAYEDFFSKLCQNNI
jgi:hypothetical protein